MTKSSGDLVRIGSFRELGYGDGSPSLSDCRGGTPVPDKARVVSYLRAGQVYEYSPGFAHDVLVEGAQVIGTYGTRTDGRYVWPDVLPYYVERYDVPLPEAFLRHAAANNWTLPADDPGKLE